MYALLGIYPQCKLIVHRGTICASETVLIYVGTLAIITLLQPWKALRYA